MNEVLLQVSVRLLAGVICAAIGAFFGALVIAMVLSSAETSDLLQSVFRLSFVAICAAITARIGWYGTVETRRQSTMLLTIGAISGIVGSWLALVLAGLFFDHTDVYVLNRDISGAGFFGAVFACNIPALIYATRLAHRREI